MEAAEKEKKIVTLTEVKPTQDGYRWVAITAMLLAIGIILAELDHCHVFYCN